MEFKLKTLTPIWTGGVEGKCDRLHETGIIGSLRWWYEALVRGLGGYACDPTSERKDERCELSGKEKDNEEREKKLCPACYLFGCSGWKRQFRLEVVNKIPKIPFQLATLDKEGKGNYWWLSQIFENATRLFFGNITLRFNPIGERKNEIITQLKALVSIMSSVGAIGAKNQYGFGLFEWEEKMELKSAIEQIKKFLNTHQFKSVSNKAEWYSLRNFWFYELKLPSENQLVQCFKKATVIGEGPLSENCLPVSFDIRYKLPQNSQHGLRESFYLKKGKQMAQAIFGTLKGNEKMGSRIFVSHLFKKQEGEDAYWLRVWGFSENYVGEAVGDELKKIFELEHKPEIKRGIELIEGGKSNEV